MCSWLGIEALFPVDNVVTDAADAIPEVAERRMIEQTKKPRARRSIVEDTQVIGETSFITFGDLNRTEYRTILIDKP